MKAYEKLLSLWFEVKAEGDCKEYVKEMCSQLELFGTESNTLTKQMVFSEMKKTLDKIQTTL